jgi:hypothetical protein
LIVISLPPQVTAAVRRELDARGAYASVAVFWGRERYVTLLWRYLERNLRVNGGIVSARCRRTRAHTHWRRTHAHTLVCALALCTVTHLHAGPVGNRPRTPFNHAVA